MAASTGPRPDLITNPTVAINYPVQGSTQIWQYEHCCVTNSGLLVPASDTSGLVYVGQASMSVNNTGADGAVTCPVQSPLINPHATFNATSPATSWIGAHVFFIDDNTVGLHGSTSIGRIATLRQPRPDRTQSKVAGERVVWTHPFPGRLLAGHPPQL
jgi:hypothetical protein